MKKLLPIGSVVRLKGGGKKIMIFGVLQTDPGSNDKKEYDYVAVCYPEGNMGLETQYLFDHQDIEEVYFRGYEDLEREAFIVKLQEVYKQMKE